MLLLHVFMYVGIVYGRDIFYSFVLKFTMYSVTFFDQFTNESFLSYVWHNSLILTCFSNTYSVVIHGFR